MSSKRIFMSFLFPLLFVGINYEWVKKSLILQSLLFIAKKSRILSFSSLSIVKATPNPFFPFLFLYSLLSVILCLGFHGQAIQFPVVLLPLYYILHSMFQRRIPYFLVLVILYVSIFCSVSDGLDS